ncbi:unnamed protein product [Owenia fusiformis]|uniref:Uncharacterized protein n=1 Tax=Owenia fusiformis TaxID=6347 RepID=A0A8J1UNU4_OWEFU|nr:unnamed protein product [Owenia fusiformis]
MKNNLWAKLSSGADADKNDEIGKRDFDIDLFREMMIMIGFTLSMDMENPGNILGDMLVKQIGCETEFKRNEFWIEKQRHQFYVWFDQDRNGVVEKKDFDKNAKNILALTKWSEGSDMATRCNDVMNTLWKELKHVVDTNSDDKVTIDEWLDFMEKISRQIKSKTMEIPSGYSGYLNLVFDLLDSLGYGDGKISTKGFVSVYRTFKIPDDVIEKCFKEMTYGGRIVMARDFWLLSSIQFSISTDMNSPGNILGKMLTEKYD